MADALSFATPSVPAGGSLQLAAYQLPVTGGRPTSGFGLRAAPMPGASTNHQGVDYGGLSVGAPVMASDAGTVVSAGPEDGYGNTIRIRHSDGNTSLYAHLGQIKVKAGSVVSGGDPIGAVGTTGRETGPHLHFAILGANGQFIDPQTVLPGGADARPNADAMDSDLRLIRAPNGPTAPGPGPVETKPIPVLTGPPGSNIAYDPDPGSGQAAYGPMPTADEMERDVYRRRPVHTDDKPFTNAELAAQYGQGPSAAQEVGAGALEGWTGLPDSMMLAFNMGPYNADNTFNAALLAHDPKFIEAAKAHHIDPETAANEVMRRRTASGYWINKGVGALTGYNPDDVPAFTTGQRLWRAGGSGLSTALIPSGEEVTLANLGKSALRNVAGALGGQGAREVAPDALKPIAGILGTVAGGGGMIAAERGLGAARGALEPFGAATSQGAAEGQAGARIAGAASNPAGLRDALAGGADVQVPGSVPTTFQQTGDLGVGALERGARARSPEPFKAREAEQNAARVSALQGVQTGGDAAEAGRFLTGQLDALDSEAQAHVEAAAADAKARTAEIGGQRPADANGADLREHVASAEQAARLREGALWNAVDPEGKLTGNVAETRDAARRIRRELPATAKPMGGEEADIFDTATKMTPLSPVGDLIALRSRVNTALREELSTNGRSPAYARLSDLRGSIQANLAKSITDAVASEQAAVAAGKMAQADTILSRLQSDSDVWRSQGLEAGRARAGDPQGYRPLGTQGVPGVAGTEVPARGGPGLPAGNSGVPAQADLDAARADLGATRTPTGSLFRAMQQLGGVKLRAADGSAVAGPDIAPSLAESRLPGLVNNRNGLSPEAMAQALADRGFFGPNVADPAAAFEAAVANEARGSKVYAAGSQEPGAAAQRAAVGDETSAAGVNAFDRPEVAAQKLATYRASMTAARARAQELGIPGADNMSLEDLRGDIAEREAIQGENGPPPPTAAESEFDRLSGPRPQTPTFDEEAAGRLATATGATRERARTFGLNPVASITAKNGAADLFRLPDGSVPGKFFHPGPNGFADIQALLKAAGDKALPVIEDYAASDLRRAAERPDGTLDPAKYAAWRTRNADALRALPPETQARFASAAEASRALAEAQGSQAATVRAFREGAAGKLLGLTDADAVTKTIGGILGGKTATADMRAIMAKVRGNPDAVAGVRQAVADHIASRLIGNTEVGTSGVGAVKADAFQTFMRQNRGALAEVFSPSELRTLDDLAIDIRRSARSDNALKLMGSNTTQDTNALGRFFGRGGGGRTMLDMLGAGLGGFAHGGEGAVVGSLSADLVQRIRAYGVARVDDLVTRALLDPDLARRLLAKVPDAPAARSQAVVDIIRAIGKPTVTTAPERPTRPQPNRHGALSLSWNDGLGRGALAALPPPRPTVDALASFRPRAAA